MSWNISAAVTCSSRCARSLLDTLLPYLQSKHNPTLPNPTLLFAFAPSSTTPPEVLSDITSTLTQLYPEHVGCISAPLPYQFFNPKICGPYSYSLACAFVNGVSFRSTISGRAETQVGRWHAARQRTTEHASGTTRVDIESLRIPTMSDLSEPGSKIDWNDLWDRTANSTLPNALQNLGSSAIDNILYFSDKSPEGLATVLEGAFPHANKLSLIASSTPFITGRPVTLFYNGSILSDGAVGIAFNSSPSSSQPVVELSFPPLVALSSNLSVTSSEGNLILSLDSGNPTQLLLNAIQTHDLAFSHTPWVDKFYVGVIDPANQRICQLHLINAGDPSRGAIALSTTSAPREGSIVRLYYFPGNAVPDAMAHIPDNISLFVVPETMPVASSGDVVAAADDGDRSVVSDAFFAASENGFTLSRRTQGPWKCVVPGGRTGLSWMGSMSN